MFIVLLKSKSLEVILDRGERIEETMVMKEMAFVIVDQAMGINFIDIII